MRTLKIASPELHWNEPTHVETRASRRAFIRNARAAANANRSVWTRLADWLNKPVF